MSDKFRSIGDIYRRMNQPKAPEEQAAEAAPQPKLPEITPEQMNTLAFRMARVSTGRTPTVAEVEAGEKALEKMEKEGLTEEEVDQRLEEAVHPGGLVEQVLVEAKVFEEELNEVSKDKLRDYVKSTGYWSKEGAPSKRREGINMARKKIDPALSKLSNKPVKVAATNEGEVVAMPKRDLGPPKFTDKPAKVVNLNRHRYEKAVARVRKYKGLPPRGVKEEKEGLSDHHKQAMDHIVSRYMGKASKTNSEVYKRFWHDKMHTRLKTYKQIHGLDDKVYAGPMMTKVK